MLMDLFFEELRDTSKSIVLVLMEGFNLPEINWEHHTAGTTCTRRLLKILDDSLEEVLKELEEVLRELARRGSLLDMLLVLLTEWIS